MQYMIIDYKTTETITPFKYDPNMDNFIPLYSSNTVGVAATIKLSFYDADLKLFVAPMSCDIDEEFFERIENSNFDNVSLLSILNNNYKINNYFTDNNRYAINGSDIRNSNLDENNNLPIGYIVVRNALFFKTGYCFTPAGDYYELDDCKYLEALVNERIHAMRDEPDTSEEQIREAFSYSLIMNIDSCGIVKYHERNDNDGNSVVDEQIKDEDISQTTDSPVIQDYSVTTPEPKLNTTSLEILDSTVKSDSVIDYIVDTYTTTTSSSYDNCSFGE